MRVLVAGSEGMLARDMVPCLEQKDHEVIAPAESALDILSLSTLMTSLDSIRPDVIVNCAAYTNVDGAEREEHKACLVNGLGVQNLCLACQAAGIPLVHFSTDYIFDGQKVGAYSVFDSTCPINAYGRSKLLGEKYVLWLLRKFYLIRTSWLFGLQGRNFVETMLGLGRKQKQVSVVSDQRGCPTWTHSLAGAVAELIESGCYGVYNGTNSGATTWYDFAVEIFRTAGMEMEVMPITTDQYPTPARRPANSVLDPFPLNEVLGRAMPPWEEALAEYLRLRKEMGSK